MAVWDPIVPYLIYIEGAIIVVAAVTIERFIARYLKNASRKNEWPPHVVNAFILTFRLLIILGAVAMFMHVVGVPPDWLLSYTALGGAAIGFASTRTIGNFIAGLFLFITHPFRVNDFVRIDSVEGIVEEITFNYTKIRMQNNTLVFISNLKILDQNVINYRVVGGKPRMYCYSLYLAFDFALSVGDLEKLFDKVIDRYSEKFPKKPEYVMQAVSAFERRYVFYLYAKNPKDIFTAQPSFVREITEAWEKAKAK